MAAPYSDPLAFFLTWSAYGSWLPGDDRGWVPRGGHVRLPDPERLDEARRAMTEPALTLSAPQRVAVKEVIRRHCDLRGWTLHAVNVRTTHVHVVVTAPDSHPKKVREELKSWGTRTLKKSDRTGRRRWWTDGGSTLYLNDEEALEEVIDYVLNRQ